jgi:hypothetical protein
MKCCADCDEFQVRAAEVGRAVLWHISVVTGSISLRACASNAGSVSHEDWEMTCYAMICMCWYADLLAKGPCVGH